MFTAEKETNRLCWHKSNAEKSVIGDANKTVEAACDSV